MASISQIREIVQPVVESNGAYLVDVVLRREGQSTIVEIFADTDQGITTRSCAEISRALSAVFDAGDIIPERYHLVVSSPGIDRPLTLRRQYAKNVGRNLVLKIQSGQKPEQLQGELVEVNDNSISVRLDDDEVRTITFDTIIESRVKAAW